MKALLSIFFSVLIFSFNLAQIHSTESKISKFKNSVVLSYKLNYYQNTPINFSIGTYLKEPQAGHSPPYLLPALF